MSPESNRITTAVRAANPGVRFLSVHWPLLRTPATSSILSAEAFQHTGVIVSSSLQWWKLEAERPSNLTRAVQQVHLRVHMKKENCGRLREVWEPTIHSHHTVERGSSPVPRSQRPSSRPKGGLSTPPGRSGEPAPAREQHEPQKAPQWPPSSDQLPLPGALQTPGPVPKPMIGTSPD